MHTNWHLIQKEKLARRSEAWMTTHRAVLELYAERLDEFRLRVENAGYSKEHPVVDASIKHTASARMDVPKLWIHKPEIPLLEPPMINLPDPPSFDFTAHLNT